ncbi:MAG: shikimate dehydrogenase [Paenibacillaceae bacterium]
MNNHLVLDSHTVMYGVFGDPVKHSKSPLMLNRAFQENGINAAYTAFHVTPEKLEAAVQGIRALGFGGVNVTIPHKLEVMRYLDDIDEGARLIGAVNTIVNRDGKLIGYNTDGIGYVRSLKEETGFQVQGSKLLLIGAGGAARGVAYALAKESPSIIYIVNRSKERAEQLSKDIGRMVQCVSVDLTELSDIPQVDFIVNTTSVGMHPNVDELPIDSVWLNRWMSVHTIVSDLVYNPLQTRFLREAADLGATTHSGLGMFVYQGAYAFEYWTGQEAPVAVMRNVVERSFQA